jgi:pimeloyl-ACP methyl ester carboxylesterase
MAEKFPWWLPRAFGLIGRIAPDFAARVAAELLTRPGGRNPPQPWELETSTIAPRRLHMKGRLEALAWGDVGPVVLAQHGWRGRPTQFGPIAVALVARGCQVVALDAPGHGVSPGKRATPRLLADSLLTAAADLPGIHAVIGHSLGGAAAAIALELGLRAHRLVLLGSPSRPSRFIAGHANRIGLPPNALRALDDWFDVHAGRAAEMLDPVSLRFGTGVRALVVHDRDDDVIPVQEAELLEPAWPLARFLYTSGLGHRDLLANPDVVESVADFVVDANATDPDSRRVQPGGAAETGSTGAGPSTAR